MEEIKNESLVEAIRKLKENNTKENQSIMLGEMMKSKFLNPTTLKVVPDENGKVNIPAGTEISFYTITSTSGKKFAMAFTSRPELDKWVDANTKAGVPAEKISKNAGIMGFMEYAGIILREDNDLDGLVINPYNENLILNRDQISSLREQRINFEKYGMTRNAIKNNEQIGLRKLNSEEYPADLINELVEHMKNKTEISSAWLLKMKKNEKESFLLVVDFEGDASKILGEIGRIAKPYLVGDTTSLDMVAYKAKLGSIAAEHGDKIYDKSGLQMFTK